MPQHRRNKGFGGGVYVHASKTGAHYGYARTWYVTHRRQMRRREWLARRARRINRRIAKGKRK